MIMKKSLDSIGKRRVNRIVAIVTGQYAEMKAERGEMMNWMELDNLIYDKIPISWFDLYDCAGMEIDNIIDATICRLMSA